MELSYWAVFLAVAVGCVLLAYWKGKGDARREYEERVRTLHDSYLRKCSELEGELQAVKRPGDSRALALAKGRPYLDAAAAHLAAKATR